MQNPRIGRPFSIENLAVTDQHYPAGGRRLAGVGSRAATKEPPRSCPSPN